MCGVTGLQVLQEIANPNLKVGKKKYEHEINTLLKLLHTIDCILKNKKAERKSCKGTKSLFHIASIAIKPAPEIH